MKVLKFGGTSVGSVNSMLSVKRIVEGIDDKVIVVVSALGGITDKLICTSKMAASGDDAYEKEMKEIVNRHIEMVYTVIPAGRGRELLLDLVNELLSELKDIFQGIYLIRDLSPKTSATIVSYGERLSSIIVATLIEGAVWMVTEQGRPSREVAAELGICIDTLRSWLKAAGAPSPGQADRQNRDARRLRELEAEIRALRKKLEEKDGVIDILKKSVGILSKP
jgi:hypothetical protein